MDYKEEIYRNLDNPEGLEKIYRQALKNGEAGLFAEAIESLFSTYPQNLLLAAWHYRLREETVVGAVPGRTPLHWFLAVLLAIPNGLIFWWLSDFRLMARQFQPLFIIYWAPIAAAFILLYLFFNRRQFPRRLALVLVALAFISFWVYWADFLIKEEIFWKQYLTLGAIHLIFLSWAAIGLYVLKEQYDVESRFAFLAKSLEALVMGGLMGIVLGIFTGISMGLFSTLSLYIPDPIFRIFYGGAGCIPVLAVASVYEPLRRLREQSFAAVFRFTTLLLRFFLFPSILILLIYIILIPFNFMEPFYNREALVVYNIMLFAVVALLLWTTPVERVELSERLSRWLKYGHITLTSLAILVSLYAFSAIIYRTWWDGLTPNRLTVIGWNTINTALLIILLWREAKAGKDWVAATHKTFAQAMPVYAGWSFLLLLALPFIFIGG
ncbi:MAG: hypothetical protein RMK30_01155 [Anaerolineae bacterium]|nr:hypothetical protein [Anaerolineae bacterium]MDW8101472.1 hypothetical protein [Anaerolineae bacterium]